MVMGDIRRETQVAIIGAGPGGYVAALRAADLGLDVVLIEERDRAGGVCLLEGCIPSKALINAVELAEAVRHASQRGLSYGELRVDIDKLREWTDSVVSALSEGIDGLLARRGVERLYGRARLMSNRTLAIEGRDASSVEFEHCIIATGSRINVLPAGQTLPLWTSTEALRLPEIPKRLLVVGGGYIGLEMGLVYAGLGSNVTVVEFFPSLLMGADPDLVEVMVRTSRDRFQGLLVDSKVVDIRSRDDGGYAVDIEHAGETQTARFDQVLMAVGRRPNTEDLGLENTRIVVDEAGHIPTDETCRTVEPTLFAIGDAAPGPMLAHKASREAKVAAEVIAHHKSAFDNRAIPAVVFTDPEIAWTGLTEREARADGVAYRVGRFPLSALGRARTLGRTEGLVKILSDPESGTVLGVGMVGPLASELIAEGTLAVEMGATLEDLMVTIHPHPTLSEALMEAAEISAGAPIHVNPPSKP